MQQGILDFSHYLRFFSFWLLAPCLLPFGSASCDREVVVVGHVVPLLDRSCLWGDVRDEASTRQGIRIGAAWELEWTAKERAVHIERVPPVGKIQINFKEVPRSQGDRSTGLERRHIIVPAITMHMSIGRDSQLTDTGCPARQTSTRIYMLCTRRDTCREEIAARR